MPTTTSSSTTKIIAATTLPHSLPLPSTCPLSQSYAPLVRLLLPITRVGASISLTISTSASRLWSSTRPMPNLQASLDLSSKANGFTMPWSTHHPLLTIHLWLLERIATPPTILVVLSSYPQYFSRLCQRNTRKFGLGADCG